MSLKISPLIFLLLAATALIFHHAWVPGMHHDGTMYAALMKNMAELNLFIVPKMSVGSYGEFFEHPPFVFMLGGLLMKLFGVSWTVARMVNFIFIATLIIYLYKLISKHIHDRYAFLATLFIILNPLIFRKARFPNLDIPLTLFTTLALFNYYQAFLTNRWKDWLLTALFFGLATLCKGHPALIIPMAIFLHLLITKEWKRLLDAKPYLSLVLGLSIFALWPLLLYLTGNIHGFELWFQRQFTGTVVDGRGNKELNFFLYFIILFKSTVPLFFLFFLSHYQIFKKEKSSSIYYLFIAWFWGTILPFSLVKFKYSHYILPLIPAYTLIAVYTLNSLKNSYLEKGIRFVQYAILLLLTLQLILPLSTKTHRDKEFIQAISILKTYNIKVDAWGDVDWAYDFWPFGPVAVFEGDAEAFLVTLNEVETYLQTGTLKNFKRWAFVMTDGHYQSIKTKLPLNSFVLPIYKKNLRIIVLGL